MNGKQIEFGESGQVVTLANRVTVSNSGNLLLRMDRDAASNNYAGNYSTYVGTSRIVVGNTVLPLTRPRPAIQVASHLARTLPAADLGWVEIAP